MMYESVHSIKGNLPAKSYLLYTVTHYTGLQQVCILDIFQNFHKTNKEARETN